jgi:hypothetical protein
MRPADIPDDAPTVTSTIDANASLSAICRQCQHNADVDLSAIQARGMGGVKLLALRLRCAACGAADCSIVVSGRPYR